jgi:predicted DNA-binding transcriptional regulator AlpA
MNLLKLPQVKAKTKKSTAGIYADMRLGVFPKNFKIGSRAVAWLDHEIDTYIQALAAGTTQAEIERLVREMLDSRESISIGPRRAVQKSGLTAPFGESEGG